MIKKKRDDKKKHTYAITLTGKVDKKNSTKKAH